MSKNRDLDWSHLYKTGTVEEDPLAKAGTPHNIDTNKSVADSNKGGGSVTKEQLRKEAMDIVKQAHSGPTRQPTDKELFGSGVVTEEMAKKADSDFNNVFNDHFNLLNTPVDSQNSKEVVNWGSRGSILDDMSDEERTARNMSGAIDK